MSHRNIRMTTQRQVILEELTKVDTHPTAAEVYELVRARLPQISLGTVYRNLEILSERGTIKKLDLGPGERHYDGHADAHHHIRCIECGRIDDAHIDIDIGLVMNSRSELCGYEVLGCRIELYGRCPACKGIIQKDSQDLIDKEE